MTRSRSIANALTAEQARMVAADFLSAVERCDEYPDIGTLLSDLQKATGMAERLAGVNEAWFKQTQRAYKCARCRQANVAKAGRICSGCRTPLEAAA